MNESGDTISLKGGVLVANKDNDKNKDSLYEGRDSKFMDIDRMVNEGLGGGNVSVDNGLIEDTTVDTINDDDNA